MRKILICFLSALLLLGGCGPAPADVSVPEETPAPVETPEPAQTPKPQEVGDEFPGTYTVAEGWVKSEKYSSESMTFYVREGHGSDELPDNISVNVGTNRYSLEEHSDFAHAITAQLMMQLQGVDAELTGDGSFTPQDYVLYTFTIKESDVTTVQYYIVDDYRFCLFHLTDFSGAEDAQQAARAMVDSFVWKE